MFCDVAKLSNIHWQKIDMFDKQCLIVCHWRGKRTWSKKIRAWHFLPGYLHKSFSLMFGDDRPPSRKFSTYRWLQYCLLVPMQPRILDAENTHQIIKCRFLSSRYEEVCKPGYDFSSGRFSGRTGHFTQVVWKESTELGMGTANSMKGSMYCWYAVARYKPAGNFMGKFKKNVEKGKFTNNICDKLDEMIAKIGSGQ